MSQNLVQTQSKRLTPIILAGYQVGIIIGGLFLAAMSKTVGVQNMLLIWVVMLTLSFLLISYWHKKHGVSPYFRAGRKERSRLRQSINQVTRGVRLMRTSRLLRMSSYALFFMVMSTYILTYTVNLIYTETFVTETSLSAFFGILVAVNSAIALLIQVFISNRAIHHFGVKRINLIFPATSILSYVGLLFSFSLPAAIAGSFNRDTMMPAFRKPVRTVFMQALPMQIQGRARAMSIVLVLPLALASAGLFLYVAQGVEDPSWFLVPGLLAAMTYLFFNRKMNQAYAAEIVSNLKQRLFVPDSQMLELHETHDASLLKDIESGVLSEDEDISLAYAKVLCKSSPARAAELLPDRMSTASVAARDQMIQMLQPLDSPDLRSRLQQEIGQGDIHLDATLYWALIASNDEFARSKIESLLNHASPRLRGVGVYGAMRYAIPELQDRARAVWLELLNDSKPEGYMPGIDLITQGMEQYYLEEPVFSAIQQDIVQLLNQSDARFICKALEILADWPTDNFKAVEQNIMALSSHADWRVRKDSLMASHLLAQTERERLLLGSLEDGHPQVRATACEYLVITHSDPVAYFEQLLIDHQLGSPRARQSMLEYLIHIGTDPQTMSKISTALATEASLMNEARELLLTSGEDLFAGRDLLDNTLQERIHEFIDLALLASQSSEHDEEISLIRAGLLSRDKRHLSNARELLSMISNQELSGILLPLFEEQPKGHAKKRHYFKDVDHVLAWIDERSDPWLNDCFCYSRESFVTRSHV
jgi:MFS family permease